MQIPVNKQIIRIDKGDGSETVETDVERVERVVRDTYLGNPLNKLRQFLSGSLKVQSSFAYYEIRDIPENHQTELGDF